MASKRFSKRTTRKTKVRLSPKEAETLFKEEFIDSRGNKHIFRIDFKPQSPFEPDYKQTIEYKDNQ